MRQEEVRARWKDYFAFLLESDQNSNTQLPGQRAEQRRNQPGGCRLYREISVEEVQ